MNRLCLSDRMVCPPEPYFRYVFPEDGYEATATTYQAWIEVVGMHASANGLATPAEADMEEQLCRTLPYGWCRYDDPNRPRPSTLLGWDDVKSALTVFGRWLKSGMKTVSQEEADRRASICGRCYMNTMVSGCAGCQRMVAEVAGTLKTRYDFALKSCAVCKCVLKVAVHLPVETMVEHEGDLHQDMYPSHCWKKVGGENYHGPIHRETEPATRASA